MLKISMSVSAACCCRITSPSIFMSLLLPILCSSSHICCCDVERHWGSTSEGMWKVRPYILVGNLPLSIIPVLTVFLIQRATAYSAGSRWLFLCKFLCPSEGGASETRMLRFHTSSWFVQSGAQFPGCKSNDAVWKFYTFVLIFSANSAHNSSHASFDSVGRERRNKTVQEKVKLSHTENRR